MKPQRNPRYLAVQMLNDKLANEPGQEIEVLVVSGGVKVHGSNAGRESGYAYGQFSRYPLVRKELQINDTSE